MYFAEGLRVHGAGKRYKGAQGARRVTDKSVLEVRFVGEDGNEGDWITQEVYAEFRRAHGNFVRALNTDMGVMPYPFMPLVNGHVTAVFRQLASAAALEWLDARGAIVEVAEIWGSNPGHDAIVDTSCVHLIFKTEADAMMFKLTFNRDTSPVASIAA